MIGSVLFIIFGLVSAIGAVVSLWKGFVPSENGGQNELTRKGRLSLCWFFLCHFLFVIIGILGFFLFVPMYGIVTVIVVALGSRVLNGRILYKKNNWSHYLFTSAFLIVSLIMYGVRL